MQSESKKSPNWVIYAVVAAVVICVCVAVALVTGAAAYLFIADTGTLIDSPFTEATVEAPAPLSRPPADSVSTATSETLSEIIVPENDPYDLACRLMALCSVEPTIPAPPNPYKVGDSRKFWIMNSDTVENFEIDATLHYVTPHSYFWVEEGVDVNDSDVAALMTAFEEKIYPTNRRFFGSEWSPGVDNDPHIYIVVARNLGASTGGYFSTADEFNPAVRQYSNSAEMFVFNAEGMPLDNEYTYGTLAHEFQHMIHWSLDRNEASWINEGFSELAAFINGYTVGGSDWAYTRDPDISLNDWTSLSDSPEVTSRHYGQAFLFTAYFLDRFGDDATQALVKHDENGLIGIDQVFQELNLTDPQTGSLLTAEDVVLDWMLAMYLNEPGVGDGRYAYYDYQDAPQTSATQTIRDCPAAPLGGSVSQFGPDYIEISCAGDHEIVFTGSTAAKVLPADAHSGQFAFWSNKGDESDMTLTREFDFTGVTGRIELSYWTWYDIEEGWDYLYLESSLDGETWEILETPSCSDDDLSGNAYGCGYTGKSGGSARWTQESIDLSDFAGKTVQLRFEYVTDAALNGEGLLLDDLTIDAIGYSEDFEAGEGDWAAQGFARIENVLPQTFRLALVKTTNDGTTVEYPEVGADQTAIIPLSLEGGESAVLLVTGTQRFTRLPASYTIEAK
jgi:hypothetical protein